MAPENNGEKKLPVGGTNNFDRPNRQTLAVKKRKMTAFPASGTPSGMEEVTIVMKSPVYANLIRLGMDPDVTARGIVGLWGGCTLVSTIIRDFLSHPDIFSTVMGHHLPAS